MHPVNPSTIEPEDFPGNSKRERARPRTVVRESEPEEKKLDKVVTGEVIRRKKPLGRKTRDFFFGSDARGVMVNSWREVMLPSGRDLFFDGVTFVLEGLVYGESRSRGRRRGGLGSSLVQNVAYHHMSARGPRIPDPRERETRGPSRRARAIHNFDEIVLATRREADDVLLSLDQQIASYQMASVADLYDILGIEREYTDAKWGWYDLANARVQHISGRDGGYLLDLPRPEPLE